MLQPRRWSAGKVMQSEAILLWLLSAAMRRSGGPRPVVATGRSAALVLPRRTQRCRASGYWAGLTGVWISCCICSLNASVAKSLVFARFSRGDAMTTARVCVLTRDAEARVPDWVGPRNLTKVQLGETLPLRATMN